MRKLLGTALALCIPVSAFAAGGGDETAPPKPALSCKSGQVYDEKTKKCVVANGHRMDTETQYQAVRQLAYAERFAEAQVILAQMPQDDDRTLTYLGFTSRKLGDPDAAMDYYSQALTRNPGNVLARSYMGQGLVDSGDIAAALVQLRAIRDHGGAGTWAEASLRTAISTGRTFNY